MHYEDLFDKLFDESSMLWFEILRLAMILTLGKNLWRISLLFISHFITMAILNKI